MKIRTLLLATLLALQAQAQLLITEVNSNAAPNDFFELYNHSDQPVNLNGWKWVDTDSPDFNAGTAVTFGDVTIEPGEVVVVVQTTAGNLPAFRAAWEIPESVRTIVASGAGPGLGSNDGVLVFDNAGFLRAAFNYRASDRLVTQGDASTVSVPPFTRITDTPSLGGHAGAAAGGTATASAIWSPGTGTLSPRYTFASPGSFSAYAQAGNAANVGSPGLLGTAGGNTPPIFSGPALAYWRKGVNMNLSPFRVTASDPDPGQTVTLEVLDKPAWLTLSPAGAGRLAPAGIPPAAGDFTFTVKATDNHPGTPGSTERVFTFKVFPDTAPVILNEYNAVAPANQLGGGAGSDTFFGAITGNGGDWFELVVTGDGTPGSTVDLRGYKLQIHSAGGTETLVLSQDPYWAGVLAGTILTFIEDNTAAGGLDTEIHRVSAHHTLGFSWSNIWIHDPVFIDQAASDFGDGIVIDHTDTQFTIRDAANEIVYGPCGEGIASQDTNADGVPDTLVGVSSTEVLKLEQDPVTDLGGGQLVFPDPFFGAYNDGTSSSFGAPNLWSAGASSQSFEIFKTPANTPPQFTSAPPLFTTGNYFYSITTVDLQGGARTVSASALPDFLTLTPGAGGAATLATNRALTLDDAGQHLVRLVVSDGTHSTPQAFLLTVGNPAPSVILNEYNAVAADKFLNGGDAATDSDGPPASVDTHFGRVMGNGGQWFELVVVGDGGAGMVDMRGWTIQVGTGRAGFAVNDRIVLSNHADWSAVPSGTILTFTAQNTAQGGLDTGWAIRDRRTTHGDVWTNIWLGDTTYTDWTSPAVNGYDIAGGAVTGVDISHQNTQFRILNAAEKIVFGPCGEGVAPVAGVSDTEVFELEDHPSPSVSPFIAATDTTPGYDDGASGSTFGFPNEWQHDVGGVTTTQNFTPFIPSFIVVRSPDNIALTSGGAAYAFGTHQEGGAPVLRAFTILNEGPDELTGISLQLVDASGHFSIHTQPAQTTLDPAQQTTFVLAFHPLQPGPRTAVLNIASSDPLRNPFVVNLSGTVAAAPPVNLEILTHPAAQFAPLGGGVTLQVVAVAPDAMTFQWLKNGRPIPGASGASLQINPVKTSDAGLYSVRVTAGAQTSASTPARLAVLTSPPALVKVKLGGNAAMACAVAMPAGVKPAFQWRKDGASLGAGDKPKGFNTAKLAIAKADANDEGVYHCQVSMTLPAGEGGAVITGQTTNTQLEVVIPPVMNDPGFGADFVSETINGKYTLSAANGPAKFTASGLPAGVKLDAATGALTGKPLAAKFDKSGNPIPYPVKLSASNLAGAGPAITVDWLVQPLPGGLAGACEMLVERDPALNSGLGSWVSLAITSTGKVSGSLFERGKKYSFTSQLDVQAGGAGASLAAAIKRARGQNGVTLGIPSFAAPAALSGSLDEDGTTESADATGWMCPFNAKNKTALAGVFNLGLTGPGGVDSALAPDGDSFATVVINAAGQAKWAGVLADGTKFTAAHLLGLHAGAEAAQLHLHAALYKGAGSVQGAVRVNDLPGAWDTVPGLDMGWRKLAQIKPVRSYTDGFGPLTLGVEGARFVKAAPGQRLTGLAPSMVLELRGGGLGASEFQCTAAISEKNAVTLGPVTGPPGSTQITGLKAAIAAANGRISGGFTLIENAGTPQQTRRAVKFAGTVVPVSGGGGAGHFTLAENPGPGQKANATPVRGGRVILKP